MNIEERVEKIREILHAIPIDGSISVLTGSNGSGKSLIRQQLKFRLKSGVVAHASMGLRTGSRPDLGGLGSVLRDVSWNATSISTIQCIKKALQSAKGNFLCLDEIEIGCSEETIAGLIHFLNSKLRETESQGCLVITHSRYAVEHLNFDHWFNMDGYDSKDEWLSRKIDPVDLDTFKAQQNELYAELSKNMK